MPGPLEGIRVLDLTWNAPGHYGSLMMADMGADVIKVEQPGKGDRCRYGPTMYKGVGARHLVRNRNKKSVTLNLKDKRAQEIFYKMAEHSDVIQEGFRPGVVKRLGIDYESIKKINPRIVYMSISGYGQDGPYVEVVGHDICYLGMGGLLNMMGLPFQDQIVLPGVNVADLATGSNGVVALLAALLARGRTGKGQYIDLALTDTVASWLSSSFLGDYNVEKKSPTRDKESLCGAFPFFNAYQCKDGKWIAIGVSEPWFWENLCKLMGRPDFIAHQDDAGPKRDEIFAYMKGWFMTKTRDEWFEFLKDKDTTVGKVLDIGEVCEDPGIKHRQMIVDQEHPVVGKIKVTGVPFKFSDTPGSIGKPAPALGEHNDEVLGMLGYSKQTIDEYRKAGVI